MYPRINRNMGPRPNNQDRFVFPFLTGALVGGAAVGLTRPRPIYNVAPGPYPYPYPPAPPMPPGPPMPYYSSSYSYYQPFPY